jgi:uncharacterized protein
MPQHADALDLSRLSLAPGEGRHLDLEVEIEPFEFGGQRYVADPARPPVRLDVSRMTGGGYSLRLRMRAELRGPCMRCLEDASPGVDVDAREIDQPGGGEELTSPYVDEDVLDLRAWTHDALSLALPAQIVCRTECAGLCPVCGADLNADPGHAHETAPDPRWAKLRELKLDG